MSSVNRISGNILFEDSVLLPKDAVIRVILKETPTGKRVAEKSINFDAKSLSIFKYLPFEFREFVLSDNGFVLSVHIDKNGNGKLESEDLVSDDLPITTGQEYFDVHIKRAASVSK
jgi:hypothetical protein